LEKILNVFLSLPRSSERYLLEIRSVFPVEIAKFNAKASLLIQITHSVSCLFIGEEVFGDTIQEVGSNSLFLFL